MISAKLKKIIDEDDSGLLDLPQKSTHQTITERLINSFSEINKFIKENGHLPNGITNIAERKLYSRLEGIKSDPKKIEILKDYDEFSLLTPVNQPTTIDQILNNDEDDIFNDDSGIYTLKNIPTSIESADYKGRQKPCEDFSQFEYKFVQCHQDLKDKKRLLKPFAREQQIESGEFFILKGVMVYVAKVGTRSKNKNGKTDARLRLIYENGTESDLLLRSLARELYRDGRRITLHEDRLLSNFENIDDLDEESGFIYILKSLSDNPEIIKIQNLYKIGFSTKPVADRIKNAEKDPTFLMAPVKTIASFRCYNLNPQKFENLLHKFFWEVRLNPEIINKNGVRYSANEWFIAPLEVIDQVVKLIINGEIVHYLYDVEREEIKLLEQ